MKQSEKVIFKPYDPNQATFLPPSLDELIPEDHQVRFINAIIDRINIDEILGSYKGGGTSSYHPRLMLKILIYGYVQRIYSCRELAKASREHIHFMWLSGGQAPDFRTINLFRKSRLRTTLKDLFTQVMQILIDKQLVDLKHYFVDGTIVEANARKHSAVWAKNVGRYEASLREQIKELFEQIQAAGDAEDQDYGDRDFLETGEDSPWSSDDLKEAVDRINDNMERQPSKKAGAKATIKKAVGKLSRDKLPRLRRYEQQKKVLAGRNSFSKTDPDATFMKGKDQPIFSKQLIAAYNIQLGTQNQFIVGYSLHQKPSDKTNLCEHLNQLINLPSTIIGDAGYGTADNYQWLKAHEIEAYLKYPGYDRKPDAYSPRQMPYDPSEDSYECPQGRKLRYQGEIRRNYGQPIALKAYECESCHGCPVREQCHKSVGNRRIHINPSLMAWKDWVDHRLSKPLGQWLKRRRSPEVESVFGQLKCNDGLRRFAMRGKSMVELEMGLKALAHNLRRLYAVKAGESQATWEMETG
ncbi:MAG: IS1182 family transposase [Balneolales bacterium]